VSRVSTLPNYWETEYQSSTTPFDVERPDEWIASLAMSGKIHGNVLDAGCGPGRTSSFLASLGYDVLGVDISVNAIERAKRKAAAERNDARFAQANVCALFGYDNHFDTVVDIGCFHSLDTSDRALYARALHRYSRPRSVVYLRAFSASNSNAGHPSGRPTPALSEGQIRSAFSTSGWVVKELEEKEIEIFISEDDRPQAKCWFAEMHYA
jgi:cyclopropane fatty-acyl-phospholipid synthase-like methyltransferase